MSGEVRIADDEKGSIGRLLITARELFSSDEFGPAALVGGLAVTCRLATLHRATEDVDTVTEGDAPGRFALEYLDDGGEAKQLVVNGVKVDVMPTVGGLLVERLR